jgi:hypothetical protein
VARRLRTLTVVSWVGGAASILPFAKDWFDLSQRATNVLLFATVVSAFALNLLLGSWPPLSRALTRLAGPPEQPARALVLVGVVAALSAGAMLVAAALVGSG